MRAYAIEIRDRATMIAAVAIVMVAADPASAYLLGRAGYGSAFPCVLLARMQGGDARHDPYEWHDRTMHAAHEWITRHVDSLEHGLVVDVEFILGETRQPKKPERIDHA